MNISAIDRIDPVRVDELRNPYLAERLRSLALNRAERIAHAAPVKFTRVEPSREQAAAAGKATTVQESDAKNAVSAGGTIDWLRNQHATHRLASAVQAFQDQQALDNKRTGAVIDLGTPEHPVVIQKYLIAFGNTPIEQLQSPVETHAGPARVGPVANVTPTRNTTEDALGTDPETRARVRRLRKTDA